MYRSYRSEEVLLFVSYEAITFVVEDELVCHKRRFCAVGDEYVSLEADMFSYR